MKKPRLNDFCLVTWKDGKQMYCNYRASVGQNEDGELSIYESFVPIFAEEAKDIKSSWSWDNVESYKIMYDENNMAESKKNWEAFKEHEKNYWKNNWYSLIIRDKKDRAEQAWNTAIQDSEFIDFLTTWVDGIGYADGEIENPSYSLYKVYRSGYNQALKEIKKELDYLEDDLK